MWHITEGYGLRWPVEGGTPLVTVDSRFVFVGRKRARIVTAAVSFGRPFCENCEFSPGRVMRDQPGVPGQPVDSTHRTTKIYVINQGDALNPARNSDYLNWPIADGAPRDAEGKPLLSGTSTAWCVFNDFRKDTTLFDSPVAGLEVQMTAWGYDRSDRIGDALFFRLKIINKSGEDIHDAYTGAWVDPFIYGDFVQKLGCDTTAALAFHYRSEPGLFVGERVPAFGAKMVQGPIVISPGDTAHVSGRKIPGYRNLGLYALWQYINAGPKINQEPTNSQELMNNMSGLDYLGNPLIDLTTNTATRYWYPGDPLSGTGWLEQNHDNSRFLMSTGPFELADGDTQEVAFALMVARGDSGLHSLQLLKQTAEAARHLYEQFEELHFGEPPPPLPDRFELFQNYPNPFNAGTTIRYTLADEVSVSLKIFDILGREVATLVNDRQPAGEYDIPWESRAEATGIYVYRLRLSSGFSKMGKMLLLK